MNKIEELEIEISRLTEELALARKIIVDQRNSLDVDPLHTIYFLRAQHAVTNATEVDMLDIKQDIKQYNQFKKLYL